MARTPPATCQEPPIALAPLIARYGLFAIFAGAGLEGEAVVVTGGVLAHKGLLPFWGVAACAAAGSLLIDQFWFFAGRFFRDRRWVRRVRERPAFRRALALLERHATLFILAFRFVYGIRTVSPIAIGTSRVATGRFVALNAVAAAVWGPVITAAGYFLGHAADTLLHRSAVRWPLLAGLALASIVAAWSWRRARAGRHLYGGAPPA